MSLARRLFGLRCTGGLDDTEAAVEIPGVEILELEDMEVVEMEEGMELQLKVSLKRGCSLAVVGPSRPESVLCWVGAPAHTGIHQQLALNTGNNWDRSHM